mmetsp:Transcript_51233/g.137454  ORF Transcript_51233/g.137454 Transcript_51233/m.137454 type:complete len:234 (-) Transcript_51233:269-970(-)
MLLTAGANAQATGSSFRMPSLPKNFNTSGVTASLAHLNSIFKIRSQTVNECDLPNARKIGSFRTLAATISSSNSKARFRSATFASAANAPMTSACNVCAVAVWAFSVDQLAGEALHPKKPKPSRELLTVFTNSTLPPGPAFHACCPYLHSSRKTLPITWSCTATSKSRMQEISVDNIRRWKSFSNNLNAQTMSSFLIVRPAANLTPKSIMATRPSRTSTSEEHPKTEQHKRTN